MAIGPGPTLSGRLFVGPSKGSAWVWPGSGVVAPSNTAQAFSWPPAGQETVDHEWLAREHPAAARAPDTVSGEESAAGARYALTPIERIDWDADQPRWDVTRGLDELVKSIRSCGLLQPVVLRPEGERYRLVCGERRLTACIELGWKSIPAVIQDVTVVEAKRRQLVENFQREGLSDIERGRGLWALFRYERAQDPSTTWNQVVRSMGISVRRGEQLRSLAQLPEPIIAWVRQGYLSGTHALQLVRLQPYPDLQMTYAERAKSLIPRSRHYGMSVRELSLRVRSSLGGPSLADRGRKHFADVLTGARGPLSEEEVEAYRQMAHAVLDEVATKNGRGRRKDSA